MNLSLQHSTHVRNLSPINSLSYTTTLMQELKCCFYFLLGFYRVLLMQTTDSSDQHIPFSTHQTTKSLLQSEVVREGRIIILLLKTVKQHRIILLGNALLTSILKYLKRKFFPEQRIIYYLKMRR
jgi:hypothetical protein